jgi:hypothetical protein
MNETLHIAPDGSLFMVAIRSFAGVNPVGPRLWRNTSTNSRPLPPLKATGLTRAEAEDTLEKWREFLRLQDAEQVKKK